MKGRDNCYSTGIITVYGNVACLLPQYRDLEIYTTHCLWKYAALFILYCHNTDIHKTKLYFMVMHVPQFMVIFITVYGNM